MLAINSKHMKHRKLTLMSEDLSLTILLDADGSCQGLVLLTVGNDLQGSGTY